MRAISTTSSAKSRIVNANVKYLKTKLLVSVQDYNSDWIALETRSKNTENSNGEHGQPYFNPYFAVIPPNCSAPVTYTYKNRYNYYN